eukprot:scaffold21691_cov23-Cyclotella_meneghiniana.AAC.1
MVCRTPSGTDGNMLFEHLGEADHTFRPVVRGGSQQQCAAREGGDLRGRRRTARGGTVDERSRRGERNCCRP